MRNSDFQQLSHFSVLLGWGNLRAYTRVVPPEARAEVSLKQIVWYEAKVHHDCFLQINKLGGWQAAVYAIKYRVFSGCIRSAWGVRPEPD
jgi:hypothetical protein